MRIESLDIDVYRIPTDQPESDGTLKWDKTEMVVVHLTAGDRRGMGWTFAPAAAGAIVRDILKPHVVGASPMAIEATWLAINHAVRNAGRSGVCMMAISAVDVALWDLKARLLEIPLVELLGPARESAPIYGSGGFTSYTESRLAEQLGGWARQGIPRVKMKVGRDPAADLPRATAARKAIGAGVELFVDANGAYSRKQALAMAEKFAELDVRWFEEPRPSDDLEGLRLLRDRGPAGMDIAAGEYGDVPGYFRRMLDAGAVDCLQADATRCGGYTGFLKVAALCDARQMPLSAHCAPQLHAHVACAAGPLRHVEYFHDHTRIASLLFDGVLEPRDGALWPDQSRPGHGIALKTADASKYRL